MYKYIPNINLRIYNPHLSIICQYFGTSPANTIGQQIQNVISE